MWQIRRLYECHALLPRERCKYGFQQLHLADTVLLDEKLDQR
jgi:hypothetical protein